MKQVGFNRHNSDNVSGYGVESSYISNVICNMCGKKGNYQKELKSKGNVSKGNSLYKPTGKLPAEVTNKYVISDGKYL